MTAENPALFTCYTCAVGFTDPALQREHYKSDWHRYNLKRKVVALPPVTSHDFNERALVQKAEAEKAQDTTTVRCDPCRKTFSCRNAYDNHVPSRRHRDAQSQHDEKGGRDARRNEKTVDRQIEKGRKPATGESSEKTDDDSDGSWTSDEGEEICAENCLFCVESYDTLESNIHHMTIAHSFFIPDVEYLIDIEGFITYLARKVGEGNMCLWCSETGKRFHSARAVQTHMLDKGHCKVLHEGDALLEYSDFYDYRSSYPDRDESEEGNDDDGGDEDNEEAVDDEGYELVLPSGATIGHRSLMRYYRQNIPERRVASNRKILPNVLSQYKALGWTGTTGSMAVKKAADIKFVQRARRKYDLNMRMKANKLQHHFRDPNGLIR